MIVPGETVEGAMVAGPSSNAVYSTDAGDGSAMMNNSSAVMYSGISAKSVSVGGLPVSSTGPNALGSGVAMDALPVYAPGVLTTTTMTGQSMTYSMPQMYSAPQAQMNGIFPSDAMGSQAMASQSMVSQYV